MKDQKRSRNSQRSRDALRLMLVVLPLVFVLFLPAFPELGAFFLDIVLAVFVFGAIIGTITHTYWLRTLLEERAFYKKFYEENALKPHKFDKELNMKHTKILLPFYLFSILVFVIIIFVFGIFSLDLAYLLPLAFGALEGVPISYFAMEKLSH